MSVEVDIIPTRRKPFSWSEVLDRIDFNELSEDAANLMENEPTLFHISSGQLLATDEAVHPEPTKVLGISGTSTLVLSILRNSEAVGPDEEYVREYGKNLSVPCIDVLIGAWVLAGYSCTVESFGGRSRAEPELFIAIAAAIAEVCQGYVLVLDRDCFSLPPGAYTPEEFRRMTPRFYPSEAT